MIVIDRDTREPLDFDENDQLEALESQLVEENEYEVIDEFEYLLQRHGADYIFDRMTAEGVQILREAFLGRAD